MPAARPLPSRYDEAAPDGLPDAADGTATRILDAAERLVARYGIEGASVRAITQAAGANIAAVHYHFGSKHDLVRALLERRIGEMDERRRPLLDAALESEHVTADDIAEVWVRPLASMALDDGGANGSYLSFLAVLQASGPDTRSLAVEAFRPQQERFATLLERALPDVAEPVRWFRFSTATDATIHTLADIDRASAPWHPHGGVGQDDLVNELVAAMAGMLRGPHRTTTSTHVRPNGGTTT
jgi:AcrR family transcriptional regulator